MLSTCFFPNASSVVEEEGNNSENDERKHSISSRCDEEIEMTFDDDVAQDLREEVSTRDDADKHGSSSGNNIIGDFAVFRDFFLAAFSDGYYKVSCCGSEGLFPGGGCCEQPSSATRDIPHAASSGSGKVSYETGTYRKRPLAVAVGFKYAEDINGRPIVITPGCRRMPVLNRTLRVRQSPPSSPASHSVNIKKIDGASNLLCPTGSATSSDSWR